MEDQIVQPMPSILRIGILLGRGLFLAVLIRTFLFFNPEYNVVIADPLGIINTCITDLVVVALWLLMMLTFVISIHRMFVFLAKSGLYHVLCLALIRNPLRSMHLLMVLAYDAQLIVFIYVTWTVDFAVVCQILQFLPAFTLVVHSALQQCFLVIVQKNVAYQKETTYTATFHLVVNRTMLFHLISTGVMAGSKMRSEPCIYLGIILLFTPHELVYRLLAISDWKHRLNSSERTVTSSEEAMEYLCLSFDDEQHDKAKELLVVGCLSSEDEQHDKAKELYMVGSELCFKDKTTSLLKYFLTNIDRNVVNTEDAMEYLSLAFDEKQYYKMTQLVTGFEQCCFKDKATSFSNVSS